MKGIFSVATFLALASALVSGAPLNQRGTFDIPANELWVITNPAPATIITSPPSSLGEVAISNGSNEIDTVVSFDVSGYPVPTSSSTCEFFIQGVTPSGSGIVQLFTLGAEVTTGSTIIPFYNQYEGQYNVNTSPSTAIDVAQVPCNFEDGVLQFVIRPQNTDDYLSWYQSGSVGAFIQYTL
jgi:hypothetical protein